MLATGARTFPGAARTVPGTGPRYFRPREAYAFESWDLRVTSSLARTMLTLRNPQPMKRQTLLLVALALPTLIQRAAAQTPPPAPDAPPPAAVQSAPPATVVQSPPPEVTVAAPPAPAPADFTPAKLPEPQKATSPALNTAPPVAPQAATAAPATPPAEIVSMGPKGLTVQSPDARFSFNLRFPFMFDAKATIKDPLPKGGDAMFPRFFGPIFTVTLYKAVTGKLIVGFQNEVVTVVNAWMDFAASPLLHLRLGKFLYPISLERQVLPLRIVMMEHGIASALLPVTEFGAQLWGATENKSFEYQLTFGNGTPTNTRNEVDLDDSKEGVGRIYLRPFAGTNIAGLKNFGFGFGGSYGKRSNLPVNTTIRTLGGRVFYQTAAANPTAGTVVADGDVVRLVPQVGYAGGPISLFAEYIRVSERLVRGTSKKTLTREGAHAVATIALTGENAVLLDIISPLRPFDLSKGDLGALELVGRAELVRFDEDAFPTFAGTTAKSAWAAGGGFNWIPTDIIRVMLNYEHTEFTAAKGLAKPKPENVVGARVQALF